MKTYDEIIAMWKRWGPQTPEDLGSYMAKINANNISNSNAIDSCPLALNVVREIVSFGTVTSYTGPLYVLTEIANAAMAHGLLCKRFGEKADLTIELVKELHATMMAGCYDKHRFLDLGERPGEFKRHDFCVGKDEVGVDPEDTEYELQVLLDELKDFQEECISGGEEFTALDVLLTGAYFHAKLEVIHPFADGNGRVGRLLLNYWLVLNGHPPVTVFFEDKQEYYKVLQVYVDQEDIKPLVDFLKVQTVKTWGNIAE